MKAQLELRLKRRLIDEKKKKIKAKTTHEKSAIGGKIRAFNEVLNWIKK